MNEQEMREEEKENMEICSVKKESMIGCSSSANPASKSSSVNEDEDTTKIFDSNNEKKGNSNCVTNITAPPTPVTIQSDNNSVDIIINNVVCNFSVRCHLNLKLIAQIGSN